MASMSRLLILFLIALLPLRGWTAQRMGLQMAGLSHSVQGASQAPGRSAECALHRQMDMQAGLQLKVQSGPLDLAPTQQPEPTSCQSCQLCMPLAASDALLLQALRLAPQPLPRSCSSAFVSAEAARYAKPPIS
jgi:hypothetical protein